VPIDIEQRFIRNELLVRSGEKRWRKRPKGGSANLQVNPAQPSAELLL
jgi:hypothetical protein